MKKLWECLLVTICFWAIVLIGPALVVLWNKIDYWIGLGYQDGSFGANVIKFLSQPIACIMAFFIAYSLFDSAHKQCVLANSIIAAFICVLISVNELWFLKNNLLGYTMVVSALVCGYAIFVSIKDIWGEKTAVKTVKIVVMLFFIFTIFSVFLLDKVDEIQTAKEESYNNGYKTGYGEGYSTGFDEGKDVQRGRDTIGDCSIVDLARAVREYYGVTPAEAYQIVEAYETEKQHGGYSREDYENAVGAIWFAAGVFPTSD